ncbi:unnamed protein product [Rotaria sp. Silwood2]|nr:unnamed protein product [Rotaria sp. Silwood2]
MTIRTQLEDLSNEIFLDIFEYLNANDIFFGFTSLNLRISLLLNSIPLHINIHRTCCRHELEFLCNHLKFHSDQVVSLQVHDQICDQTSVIAYLFHRHDFINLHSCIFYSINSSSKLKIAVEKLSKLPKIVLFRIIQSCNVKEDKLNTSDAFEFSQLILIDTPSTLRSTSLYFHYNHTQIATISKVTTNLTHLQIIFYGTLNDISIYSLIPLLRIHRALRTLCVTIKSTQVIGAYNTNVPHLPFINENDLPLSSLLKSFDLQIVMAPCDIYSIGLILHCMPNLYQFVFTLIRDRSLSPFIMDLIDGQNWQEMLTSHVPYLKKFDFHISLLKYGQPLDFDNIVNSFRCLVNLYHQWDMCISRWEYWPNILFVFTDHIHMWTLNYNHLITRRENDIPSITMSDTFYIQSTNIFNLNNRQLNFHHHKMDFFMPSDRTTLSIQLPTILPFQNITYIVCHLAYPEPSVISFLQNTTIRLKRILSLFTRDDDDSQKYFDNLSRLVNLSNIDTVEFSRNNDIRRLNVIERVLL